MGCIVWVAVGCFSTVLDGWAVLVEVTVGEIVRLVWQALQIVTKINDKTEIILRVITSPIVR